MTITRGQIERWLAAAGFAAGLGLSGCGSGVTANLLPGTSKAVSGVPSNPTLGYVFSASDGTLRAMIGVRGSSQLSTSIVPAGVYVAGEVSRASSTALLEDGTGSLFAFDLPLPQPIHVADGLPAGAQVVFAPSGQYAVVYAPGASSVMVVSGLAATSQVQSPQVQSRAVPGGLVAAVVSDAGNVVAAVQGTPLGIGTVSAAGLFARVATVSALGGMNFLPGSDSLLLADGSANTAALVRNVSTGPSSLALSVPGLNQPVAIAGSQNNNWAVIADGGDQNLFRVDLSGATAAVKLSCACQPTALSGLSGGAAFRVNGLYGGPVWTVDTSSATPQLLFVPAIAKGSP